MADQDAFDRRTFFQRFRARGPGPNELGEPGAHLRVDRLPLDDPEAVRALVLDWHPDAATEWEDGALVVFTQVGSMSRWDLTSSEVSFLQRIDGRLSIGSVHDAVAVEHPATDDRFPRRIVLVNALLDARILRIVRDAPAA